MATRAQFRQRFHEILGDDSVPIADVKTFFVEQAGVDGSGVGTTFSSANARWRPGAKPVMMWLVLRAMKVLLENLPELSDPPCLIIATELGYRPHASVSALSEDLYVIRLGRFLFDGLAGLALILDDLVVRPRAGEPDVEFGEVVSGERLLDALQQSLHCYQLPYYLASVYAAEKYTFALKSHAG